MQWWNDFVDWFYSDAGSHVVSTVIVPSVAIVVAGVIAALIGRGSTKRIVSMHDRDARAAAVTAMIGAARRAANSKALSAPEQQHAEHIALECDVRLRLLPATGAAMVADWATHQLGEIKQQAMSFSFQADQTRKEFAEHLLEWQSHPGRAKKLFKADLDSWAYAASLTEQDLAAQQKAWEDQQASEAAAAPDAAPAPDAPAPSPDSGAPHATPRIPSAPAPAGSAVAPTTPGPATGGTAAPRPTDPVPAPPEPAERVQFPPPPAEDR